MRQSFTTMSPDDFFSFEGAVTDIFIKLTPSAEPGAEGTVEHPKTLVLIFPALGRVGENKFSLMISYISKSADGENVVTFNQEMQWITGCLKTTFAYGVVNRLRQLLTARDGQPWYWGTTADTKHEDVLNFILSCVPFPSQPATN